VNSFKVIEIVCEDEYREYLIRRKKASWLVSKFFYSWLMALVSVISAGFSSVYVYRVELGYNVMKGTEYFVSL
jgi:hypothetical protein